MRTLDPDHFNARCATITMCCIFGTLRLRSMVSVSLFDDPRHHSPSICRVHCASSCILLHPHRPCVLLRQRPPLWVKIKPCTPTMEHAPGPFRMIYGEQPFFGQISRIQTIETSALFSSFHLSSQRRSLFSEDASCSPLKMATPYDLNGVVRPSGCNSPAWTFPHNMILA